MTWLMQNPVAGSGVVTLVALLISAFIVWLVLMAILPEASISGGRSELHV